MFHDDEKCFMQNAIKSMVCVKIKIDACAYWSHVLAQNCGKFMNIMIIAVIDGVDTSSMTRDQLEKFAHNLKNEVEKEREERNYFQLERDQLRTFWEITKNQLGEWISGFL